jgi:hypothetical protein
MKKRKNMLVGLAMVLAVLLITAPAMANTTVTGEVGASGEIITEDGTIYIIADSEKGEEVSSMVGEMVTITGTVQEDEGEKTITVESFRVIPE